MEGKASVIPMSRSGSLQHSPKGSHASDSSLDLARFIHENDDSLEAGEHYGNGHSGQAPPGYLQLHPLANDAASSRTKARAAFVYLVLSTIHQLVVYKLTQRTFWPNVVGMVPVQYAIPTVFTTVFIYIGKARGNATMQRHFGTNLSIVPSKAWKEVFPLAVITLASTVAFILQAGMIAAPVGTTVEMYTAPVLLILLPLLNLSGYLPTNSLLTLCALSIPLVYGLAISGLIVATSTTIMVTTFVLLQAGQFALLKKNFASKGSSTLIAVSSILPIVLLLSLVSVLPVAIRHQLGKFKPHHWHRWAIAYLVTSLLQQVSLFHIIGTFDSPVNVAIIGIIKGFFVTSLSGGFTQGLNGGGATSNSFYYLLSSLAIPAILLSIPEIRSFFKRKSPDKEFSSDLPMLILPPTLVKKLAYASFIPLLYWVLAQQALVPFDVSTHIAKVHGLVPSTSKVDIVISYFDEPRDHVKAMIDNLKYYPWIRQQDPRFILYLKNSSFSMQTVKEETGVDVVIPLANRGRESGTYLQHILRNYNQTIDPSLATSYRSGLADHTVFMQPHLAWDWIARERIWLYTEKTGYLHFAPYVKMNCSQDMQGNGVFVRYPEVFSIFTETFCPPEPAQLAAYSAQFVVSRRRILANPYSKYKALDDLIEADEKHWLHREAAWEYHGHMGPSNPFLGHVVERSWPVIMGCNNITIAEKCTDDVNDRDNCQCFDP